MFVNIDCGFFGCLFGLLLLWLFYKILDSAKHKKEEKEWKEYCERENKRKYTPLSDEEFEKIKNRNRTGWLKIE